MKVALVQMKIDEDRPVINLKKAAQFVQKAKQQKANVVVFPEDFLIGPFRGNEDLVDTTGKYRKFFQQLAQENGIDIVAGAWIEQVGKKRYNTCYYMDSSGRVLMRYRKVNLWRSEKPYVSAGDRPTVFQTRYGKAGLTICWDLVNPLLFREMAKQGVKIVYCPSFWHSAGISNFEIEKNNINALCYARAFENEVAIVYVNAAGKRTKNDELIGYSQVVLPIRGAIARLTHNREAIAVANIDLAILKKAKRVYWIGSDIQNPRRA